MSSKSKPFWGIKIQKVKRRAGHRSPPYSTSYRSSARNYPLGHTQAFRRNPHGTAPPRGRPTPRTPRRSLRATPGPPPIDQGVHGNGEATKQGERALAVAPPTPRGEAGRYATTRRAPGPTQAAHRGVAEAHSTPSTGRCLRSMPASRARALLWAVGRCSHNAHCTVPLRSSPTSPTSPSPSKSAPPNVFGSRPTQWCSICVQVCVLFASVRRRATPWALSMQNYPAGH